MEKVAMELTEEQFRYLRLLDGLQEDEKYTAADLAERTGDKERNVRRYLGGLVEEGYLLPRTYQITEKGRRSFRRHLRWWQGVYWFVGTWGITGEEAVNLADQLFFTASNQLLEHIQGRYSMEQMREQNQAEMEIIDHTDFFGQIKSGMYKEGICFWDLDENGGYFRRLSPASSWFLPEAELMIELKRSRLVLHWHSKEAELLEVYFDVYGKERVRKPKENTLQLPIDAFTFIRVPKYRMLEGSLDIRLRVLKQGEDGKTRPEEYKARLELPMIARDFCEYEREEGEGE